MAALHVRTALLFILATVVTGFTPQLASSEAGFTVQTVPLPFMVPSAIVAMPITPDSPAGSLLVANLADGTVWRVDPNGNIRSPPIIDLPSSPPDGEYGLLGLAIHPNYPTPPLIYAFYTEEPTAGLYRFQTIVRFNYFPFETVAHVPVTIVGGLTTGAACCHNGGRVRIGPDLNIYATLGDNMISPQAQIPALPPGSILRWDQNGQVTPDSPYAAMNSPVVVTGIRNAFGLWFDPILGMVVTDNGPSGFDGIEGADEVNILAVGNNAGWPVMRGAVCQEVLNFVCPLWQSGNTHLGPTGVTVPRNSLVPEWNDKILWCNVNTDSAMILDPAAANPVPQTVFNDCSYDVAQDSAGRIVFATNNGLRIVS